jgi:hypothetical protein
MSHIHLIGGEKGGVGKSLLSRVLAQYFIDRNVPFVGFDTDRSHGALLRFYGAYATPLLIDGPDSLDRIVEAAAEVIERRVLVDLAAQTQPALVSWIEDSGVLALTEELGIGLTYWHVMDAGRDSVDLLALLLDQLGGRIGLVLVHNEIRGENFELLAASGLLERARGLGARSVRLRRLPDATMQKIDGQNTSFWAAVNHSERAATGLGLLDRQRVKVWLQRAYDEIDRIGT